MAIKVQGITVIDDGRNIINGIGASFSGIITANTFDGNFSGDGSNITGLATNLSELTNDVGFVTFTNNNQLTNGAGYITTSFTNTNQLTNGAGFVTFTNNNQLTNGAGYITTSFTDTNQLTNGAGFVTFTNNNQLTNGAGYITTSFTDTNQLTNGAGFVTFTNNNQLTNGAGFVTFTNNDQLTNGAGYITTSFTNTNQLTNGAGFITTSFTNTNQLTNGAGFVTFTNNDQLTNGAGYITTSFTNTNQLTNGAGFITNNVTGIITATTFDGNFSGNVTGIASTATKLETSRNFSITGDFVTASSISFDGTDNVSLAATITTDSIALGTYTTGDYVESISGTGNQITVTSGTGEGSTPVISIPNNPTLPGTTVTVATDLQVNRNLNVTGNVTIGGTSATIFAETLKITDADLILGFRTDANGNDISNDTTANHGGIAIASTEGTPLVSLIGAGETLPVTYKKIMWFESGAFTGLATDAWLSNYAFGVGTTSMSAGTKFAVGNIETDFDDITSVRHIDSSGIVTASTLVSNVADGTSPLTVSSTTLVTNLNADKLDGEQGTYYLDYSNFTGIATDSDKLDGQQGSYYLNYSNFSGIATDADKLDGQQGSYYLDYSNFTGIATDSDKLDGEQGTYYLNYSNFSGIATDSDKLDGEQGTYYLNYSNFSGIATDSDKLDGEQGTYYLDYSNLTGISTSIVGDTSPQLGGNLDINSKVITGTGGINVTGVVTATTFSGNLPTTDLTGTITNSQLAGSIANSKLVNDNVSFGGVSVDLGASDATPAFDLSDATAYPYTSLTGITTEILGDTTPQLGGNLDLNSKVITGTGGINVTGVVTATSFSGSGANLTSIPNSALTNDNVSFGGVSVDLGASDATPAFDLSDATAYPYTSLTGITTEIVGDTTPQLGGNLDINSKVITGTGGINVTGVVTATSFSGSGSALTELTGASAATYGDASNVAQIVVNSDGKITDISNVTISGGDTVSITTTAADILSVSSGAISADDAGADKIVFWDDSEGKLTYLTVGTNLTVTDTTISASGGGSSGPDPVIMGMIF